MKPEGIFRCSEKPESFSLVVLFHVLRLLALVTSDGVKGRLFMQVSTSRTISFNSEKVRKPPPTAFRKQNLKMPMRRSNWPPQQRYLGNIPNSPNVLQLLVTQQFPSLIFHWRVVFTARSHKLYKKYIEILFNTSGGMPPQENVWNMVLETAFPAFWGHLWAKCKSIKSLFLKAYFII